MIQLNIVNVGLCRPLTYLCLLLLPLFSTMTSPAMGESLTVVSACQNFISDISTRAGAVTKCFWDHLSPYTICGSCSDDLARLRAALENRTALTPHGVPCADMLIYIDRNQLDLIDYVSRVWNNSFCSMCLKRQVPYQPIIPPSTYAFNLAHWPPASVEFDDDPTAVASNFQQITTNMDVYNNNTIELFRRLNLTIDCFQRYISNTSVDLLDYLSYPPNDQVVVNRSVCSVCMPLYIDLVDYYENSIQSADQMDPSFTATTLDVIIQRTEQPNPSFTTCFDVQRTVNRTEWAWAHLLHCQAEGNRVLGAVLPLLVCVVFLLLFHTVLCTVFRNPVHSVVYRPKRVEPRHPAGLSRQNTFSSQPRGLARYGSLAQNASQYGSTQALIHSYRVDRDQDERSRLLPQ